jgi:hypothetical protein
MKNTYHKLKERLKFQPDVNIDIKAITDLNLLHIDVYKDQRANILPGCILGPCMEIALKSNYHYYVTTDGNRFKFSMYKPLT